LHSTALDAQQLTAVLLTNKQQQQPHNPKHSHNSSPKKNRATSKKYNKMELGLSTRAASKRSKRQSKPSNKAAAAQAEKEDKLRRMRETGKKKRKQKYRTGVMVDKKTSPTNPSSLNAAFSSVAATTAAHRVPFQLQHCICGTQSIGRRKVSK